MEPITGSIVAVLVTGATAVGKGFATEAIKDAYRELKQVVQRRLGAKGDVVERVAQDPSDQVEHQALELYAKSANLASDADARAAAQRLLAALKEVSGRPEAAAVFDLERLKAASVDLSDSEYTDTFFRAKDVELTGDFKAKGIRRADGGGAEKKT